jgi:hypothetical protein
MRAHQCGSLRLAEQARRNAHAHVIQKVIEYKTTARDELGKIYVLLTGETGLREPSVFEKNQEVRFGNTHVYLIYEIAGILYYGNDQREYPAQNKMLWPWTLEGPSVSNPIPRDVWEIICQYLSLRDIARLGTCNRFFRELITRDERCWRWHRKILCSHIFATIPLLEACGESMYRFTQELAKLSRTQSIAKIPAEWLAFYLNSLAPFGDKVLQISEGLKGEGIQQRIVFVDVTGKRMVLEREKSQKNAWFQWGRRFCFRKITSDLIRYTFVTILCVDNMMKELSTNSPINEMEGWKELEDRYREGKVTPAKRA